MTQENGNWSSALQQQTKIMIDNAEVNPADGRLHFKNRGCQYGYMTW